MAPETATSAALAENPPAPPAASDTKEEPRRGRPPGKVPEPDFWARVAGYEWTSNRFIGYLNRLEPRREIAIGQPKFIMKFTTPIDQQQIMQDYGSGKYQIFICENSGTSKKTNQVDHFVFTIENFNYPPMVPVGEWLDDPVNRQWAWAKPMLERRQKEAANPQPQPVIQPADPSKAIQAAAEVVQRFQPDPAKTVDMLSNAYEKGRQQGEGGAKTTGVGELATVVNALVTPIVAALKPADRNGPDPMIGFMQTQLEVQREQHRMQMEAIREQAKADREAAERRATDADKRHNDLMTTLLAEKRQDPVEQFAGFAKLIAAVTDLREGIGSGDDSWMGVLRDGVREAMPHLAPALGGMLGGALRFAGGAPANPGTPNPQQRQANAPQLPAGQQTASQPVPQTDPHIPAYQYLFQNFARVVNSMNRGVTGVEFAGMMADLDGDVQIELLKSAGTQRLIAAIKTSPDWNQIAGIEPKLTVFLNELMTWDPNSPEPEDEEENVPDDSVPVGAPAPKVKRAKAGKIQ